MEFDDMRKPNYSADAQMRLLEKLHAHYDKETISLKELNAFLESISRILFFVSARLLAILSTLHPRVLVVRLLSFNSTLCLLLRWLPSRRL
jgi:hypothetical protein